MAGPQCRAPAAWQCRRNVRAAIVRAARLRRRRARQSNDISLLAACCGPHGFVRVEKKKSCHAQQLVSSIFSSRGSRRWRRTRSSSTWTRQILTFASSLRPLSTSWVREFHTDSALIFSTNPAQADADHAHVDFEQLTQAAQRRQVEEADASTASAEAIQCSGGTVRSA